MNSSRELLVSWTKCELLLAHARRGRFWVNAGGQVDVLVYQMRAEEIVDRSLSIEECVMAEPQKPTIGRIVHYYPHGNEHLQWSADNGGVHFNDAQAEGIVAAVIVAVWSDTCVNLKLLTDGPVDIWKTSVMKLPDGQDLLSGFWDWPPRS